MKSKPIGVFDSGLGGLTVVKAIRKELPKEKLAYFGDTARIPYGTKGPETILRYSEQIVRFLLKREKVKAVVVACNTSSAWALKRLREEFDIPILGVIEPGAATAVSVTRNGKIGVIGTEGTIDSKAYPKAIRALSSRARVVAKACPLFVSLVEEGKLSGLVAEAVAREYLRPVLKSGVDTLLLGCTHYPLLRKTLAKVAGPHVRIVDSAEETARNLRSNLEAHGIEMAGHGGEVYYVSDLSRKFKEQAQRFLGKPIRKVERIFIENY
ncbi:MAG: glutamate racemase [bacterium]